jgi:hypothetical protein
MNKGSEQPTESEEEKKEKAKKKKADEKIKKAVLN